jgi:hypothetical protein
VRCSGGSASVAGRALGGEPSRSTSISFVLEGACTRRSILRAGPHTTLEADAAGAAGLSAPHLVHEAHALPTAPTTQRSTRTRTSCRLYSTEPFASSTASEARGERCRLSERRGVRGRFSDKGVGGACRRQRSGADPTVMRAPMTVPLFSWTAAATVAAGRSWKESLRWAIPVPGAGIGIRTDRRS